MGTYRSLKTENSETRVLRQIEVVTKMDSDRLKDKSVVDRIETQQLQWSSHVVRMSEDSDLGNPSRCKEETGKTK